MLKTAINKHKRSLETEARLEAEVSRPSQDQAQPQVTLLMAYQQMGVFPVIDCLGRPLWSELPIDPKRKSKTLLVS